MKTNTKRPGNCFFSALVLVILLSLWYPSLLKAQHHSAAQPDTKPATLLPGMGNDHHPITTKNPEAQRFFDQGLMMIFGFNRPEAVRSFRRAAELDPQAAMPHWGLSLALGRHLNMDTDMDVQAQEAHQAIQKAVALRANASPVEQAYIQALAKRCSGETNADWEKIDQDYHDAMQGLMRQYPDDLDAASLYAESVMNLNRYRWYDAKGNPSEEAEESRLLLETIMRRNPDHALANHLYIHLLDTSPHPEHALASAYRLANLVPGAGHLVHMPSHILMTLGDYEMVAKVNEQAVQADQEYLKRTGVSGNIYTHMYYPHNLHMIVRARMEQGRYNEAKQAADKIKEFLEPDFDKDPMMIDYFLPNVLFVLLRFQQWDEVLAMPMPHDRMYMTKALWHYGQTLALAAKGRREEATAAKAAFSEARSKVPSDWIWMFNAADTMLNLSAIILEARLASDEQTALTHWKRAVAAQDALNYEEPPAWYYPVRESLGSALLRAGQAAEAEAVFRENLKLHPRNGRSLFGLLESLKAQQKNEEVQWIQREFDNVWKPSPLSLQIDDF